MFFASCILGLIGSFSCGLIGLAGGILFGFPLQGGVLGISAWFLVGILKIVGLCSVFWIDSRGDKFSDPDPCPLTLWEKFHISSYLIACNIMTGPYPMFPVIM